MTSNQIKNLEEELNVEAKIIEGVNQDNLLQVYERFKIESMGLFKLPGKVYEMNIKHYNLKFVVLVVIFIIYGSIISYFLEKQHRGNFSLQPIVEYHNSQNLEQNEEDLKSNNQESRQYKSLENSQIYHMSVLKSEQSMVREILQTYQNRKVEITEVQTKLADKNTHAINEARKQIKRTYDNFEQKLDQVAKTKKSLLISLKLFPFLQLWATTPKPTTIIQKVSFHLFTHLFYGQTYLWDDLYDMLRVGGFWQSSGQLLTVATYSKVIEDQHGSLQIFAPTIITLEFPYDTPANQTVKFIGIRMRYDLHTRVETRWISQFLGELQVSVTEQERELGEPVKRIFFCEQEACNFLYSMVQLRTANRVRLHSVKIDSVFTVGK